MYFMAQSHIIQILISYLLGFFGIYCRNPLLPLNGSNCSSMQIAELTRYNDWHKPMNLSQIYQNDDILSSKQRSVLVALSSNLITAKRRRTIMFSLWARATLGGVLLQVKSLPWKTFVFLSMFLNAQRLCFPTFHGHQCQQHCTESRYNHQDLPLQHLLHLLNHLVQYHHHCVCRPRYHHCRKLDNWSHNYLEIVQGEAIFIQNTGKRYYSSIL